MLYLIKILLTQIILIIITLMYMNYNDSDEVTQKILIPQIFLVVITILTIIWSN